MERTRQTRVQQAGRLLKLFNLPIRLCESQGRSNVNREVQTVNREADKEGAVETGVKRGLKREHETVNSRQKWCTNRELGRG